MCWSTARPLDRSSTAPRPVVFKGPSFMDGLLRRAKEFRRRHALEKRLVWRTRQIKYLCDPKFQIELDRIKGNKFKSAPARFILLKFAVERGLADAEQPRGGQFVPRSFPQRSENRAALERVERHEFIMVGLPFSDEM